MVESNAKQAVANALELYAETSGMTVQEVGARFAADESCRQNIYLLVAMQSNQLPYGRAALAKVTA